MSASNINQQGVPEPATQVPLSVVSDISDEKISPEIQAFNRMNSLSLGYDKNIPMKSKGNGTRHDDLSRG
jgi:hypothetical protein